MRLVDTNSLDVVEVAADAIPRYAILSHTWTNEEVTLQDIRQVTRRQWSHAVSPTVTAIKAKKGYIKLERAAALAAEHDYRYLWIDTCCIDKTSSAELSEAINSMFKWYQGAGICYAYLADVYYGYDNGQFGVKWNSSRWFTRGWTLQELIAPEDVLFYGSGWEYIGSKAHDGEVREVLSTITGIDLRILEGVTQPSEISIAVRMKWASRRQTTRVEDLAYCLMGIFDINMPLLYGEGRKAYIRLQEEILKVSDDHSIFTWQRHDETTSHLHGLLAESPQEFVYAENYRPLPPIASRGSEAWTTTNQGLRLPLFLQRISSNGGTSYNDYNAILECSIRRQNGIFWSPAITLRRLYGDQFARIRPDSPRTVPTSVFEDGARGSYEIVFVKKEPAYAAPHIMLAFENIPTPESTTCSCFLEAVWPRRYWDASTAIFKPDPTSANRIVGIFRFRHSWSKTGVDLAVGLNTDSEGAWNCQAIQRNSVGSLTLAMGSANDYYQQQLTSTAALLVPGVVCRTSTDQLKTAASSDWLLRPWRPLGQSNILQAHINATKQHDRLYYLVRVTLLPELLGETVLTSIPPSPSRLLPNITKERPSFSRPQQAIEKTVIRMIQSLMPTETLIPYYRDITGLSSSADMYDEGFPLLKIGDGSDEQFAFHQACHTGDIFKVTSMLAKQKPPLLQDWLLESVIGSYSGYRPIHWAAYKGDIGILDLLLRSGASFDSRTKQGWTPMHLAALRGRFIAMETLITRALEGPAKDMEDLFFDDRNNDWQESPLHVAVGHLPKTLSKHERLAFWRVMGRFEESSLWSTANKNYETPMHRAASVGHDELVFHLEFESHFRYPGKYLDGLDRTILWRASNTRTHSAIERLLTKFGMPLDEGKILCNIGDRYGLAPLHAACRIGDAMTVQRLLKAGADANAVTSPPGLTPAHIAALYGHESCLHVLIFGGALLDQSLEYGQMHCTALHLARMNKYASCVKLLEHHFELSTKPDIPCTHWIRTSDAQLLAIQSPEDEQLSMKAAQPG